MKKLSGRLERWASQRYPNLYYALIQRPRAYIRFSKERKLAAGEDLSRSSRQSILFFTTQKCASRFVDDTIASLATSAGMVHADYDAYVAMLRVKREHNPFAKDGSLARAFKSSGYYYGPMGTYREIPDLNSYKIVLQLRDPRDVLTSLYYSTAFSHAVISKKLIRRRKEALLQTVDEFAISSIEEYLPIYSEYCDNLLGRPKVLFLKYEEMVSSFPTWLERLSRHVGLHDQQNQIQQLIAKADFSVTHEDKYSQKRQVTPGDYLRKLRPETIADLNSRFHDVLQNLGYQVS